MIVDCAVYREGQRVPGDFTPEAAFKASRCDDSFVWIGLHEPTEAEFEVVRVEFGLHELAIEDAVKAHQRPKLERYGHSLLLVLKTARYVDRDEVVQLGEILLFLGEGFIVAVRHGEASGLKEVRRSLELRPDFLANGPSAVLYGIVDRVVDDYIPVVAGLEDDIEQVEAEVFSSDRANPVERIYYLKREVLEFRRATAPLLVPLNQLAVQPIAVVRPEVREYFRDVYDHLLRVNEQVESFRDLLTSILEANLTQMNIRQNEDMRRISAWVAIAVVPTMIAGIYGMNFEYMPELRSPVGYPLVLVGMFAICSGMYVFFRKRDWL
ncbi:MAG TPA: magnesium/cobalt transporter CorA [Vicinamibacteria bacterium]|nr:magnesium/cobalt transporter CorA [Vicinamibacteria bacterium]